MMKSGEFFSVTTPMRWTSWGRRGRAWATPVLDVHLRLVQVGAELERDGQGHTAVGGSLREHVEHVLDAVDLLLERRGHGFRDDARAGARVGRLNDHRRRHHLQVLADRQDEERQRAGDHEDEREDGGEDGPVDEEAGRFIVRFSLLGRCSRRGRRQRPIGCLHRDHVRRHLRARPHPLEPVQHDPIPGSEPRLHDAQALHDRTQSHLAIGDDSAFVDHVRTSCRGRFQPRGPG